MLTYIVKEGDTLWQISKNFQITLDSLLHANPQIYDPNYILPGTEIYIPEKIKEQPRHSNKNNNKNPQQQYANPNQGMNMPYEPQQKPMHGKNMPYEQQQKPMHGKNMPYEQQQRSVHGMNMPYEQQQRPIQNPDTPPFVYNSKQGETMPELAQRYGVDLKKLQKTNLHISPQKPLKENETVFIPVPDNFNHPNQQNRQQNNYMNPSNNPQLNRHNNTQPMRNPFNKRRKPFINQHKQKMPDNNSYYTCPYCGRTLPQR